MNSSGTSRPSPTPSLQGRSPSLLHQQLVESGLQIESGSDNDVHQPTEAPPITLGLPCLQARATHRDHTLDRTAHHHSNPRFHEQIQATSDLAAQIPKSPSLSSTSTSSTPRSVSPLTPVANRSTPSPVADLSLSTPRSNQLNPSPNHTPARSPTLPERSPGIRIPHRRGTRGQHPHVHSHHVHSHHTHHHHSHRYNRSYVFGSLDESQPGSSFVDVTDSDFMTSSAFPRHHSQPPPAPSLPPSPSPPLPSFPFHLEHRMRWQDGEATGESTTGGAAVVVGRHRDRVFSTSLDESRSSRSRGNEHMYADGGMFSLLENSEEAHDREMWELWERCWDEITSARRTFEPGSEHGHSVTRDDLMQTVDLGTTLMVDVGNFTSVSSVELAEVNAFASGRGALAPSEFGLLRRMEVWLMDEEDDYSTSSPSVGGMDICAMSLSPSPGSEDLGPRSYNSTRDAGTLNFSTMPPSECSICLDHIRGGDDCMQLPCRHWFHTDCIKDALRCDRRCPNCRQSVGRPSTTPVPVNQLQGTAT